MEKKINIAELLKDCPKGMKLYSPLCGECKLYDVNDYNIRIEASNKDTLICLYHDGRYCANGEIMLFPKGKTTWEGFQRPFKDGDVVVAEDDESFQLFLLKHLTHSEDDNSYDGYCYFGWDFQRNELFEKGNWGFNRLATEEEKQKLLQAIKDNGYKWDSETKTLEKIKPNFKVGDKIKRKDVDDIYTDEITTVEQTIYTFRSGGFQSIEYIDKNYELIPNKFDITTLKPLESKVLVRDCVDGMWKPTFWGKYLENSIYSYLTANGCYKQCIPYEGNEHLLGTSNNCDDFYKIW